MTENWSKNLVAAVNDGRLSEIAAEINDIFREAAGDQITTTVDPHWTIELAKQRTNSAPLPVVTRRGTPVVDLWVQRQHLPNPTWTEYYPLFAIKIDSDLLLRKVYRRVNDRRSLLEKQGVNYDWQPNVAIGNNLVHHSRTYVRNIGYAVTIMMDSDGRYILEGVKNHTLGLDVNNPPTLAVVDNQIELDKKYRELGIVPRRTIDELVDPVVNLVQNTFDGPVRNVRSWMSSQPLFSKEVQYRFKEGPWRRVGHLIQNSDDA